MKIVEQNLEETNAYSLFVYSIRSHETTKLLHIVLPPLFVKSSPGFSVLPHFKQNTEEECIQIPWPSIQTTLVK